MDKKEIRHAFLTLWDQAVESRSYNKKNWLTFDLILSNLIVTNKLK